MECDVDLEIPNSIHNAMVHITLLIYQNLALFFGHINHPLKYNNNKVLEHNFFGLVTDH